VKLRDVARRLKEHDVRVVLSNSDVPFVRDLYRDGFTCTEVKATRAVNCRAERRGAITELLIT
jgi:DNA adenine methylase